MSPIFTNFVVFTKSKRPFALSYLEKKSKNQWFKFVHFWANFCFYGSSRSTMNFLEKIGLHHLPLFKVA